MFLICGACIVGQRQHARDMIGALHAMIGT